MPKPQGGFTLVELTAVITIVGALSAVALPRYMDTMRSARIAKMELARHAVNESAQIYHLKWMLAGSPAAATVLGEVEMNGAGYPTSAGILVAAGLTDHYDTRVAGVIAADPQHPACRLVYAPASGTSSANYADGAGC
ncbi:type II secretion system protein [Massilia sp. Bi118]|uniref:type II secretion system protein n=1 Tax=Massilia sp. Bi118 TaxID=2822346 RepID=UPI001E4AC9F2|nr:prepilin-type N-terminal cleavage/methylation domain-containing protein [Massilia sp. Bi118]